MPMPAARNSPSPSDNTGCRADHPPKDFNAPWVKVSVAKLQAIRNCKQVGISIERGQVK